MKAEKADEWDRAARWPLASATPPPLCSPLSALTPSGDGLSGVSPKFIESWTPMLGFPLVPLAPLNPLPFPVTLSQVEDVVATSNMVQDIQSHHLPPPPLSSSLSPPSLEMAIDDIEDSSSPSSSQATSYIPWVISHLVPTSGLLLVWRTWLTDTLRNEVPAVTTDAVSP
jgi:hypothetical protein